MNRKSGVQTRKEWVTYLDKIAYPMLNAMANNRLKEEIPLTEEFRNFGTAILEAIGRAASGIAPWIELDSRLIEDEDEKRLQEKYRKLLRKAMANAVNPESADYCRWNKSENYRGVFQPTVDAAYFASAILKAPKQLWELQEEETKKNILKAFDKVLMMRPARNNWLMFTAIIETCKYVLTGVGDSMRIEYAISKHYEWYVGDGAYKDGENFAWDYYNSYVIQPMLEEVTRYAAELIELPKYRQRVETAMKRYSEIQERMIAPDGSYPPIGRSITYRMAAFQSLAHSVYSGVISEKLKYGQVRRALDKVISKAMSAPNLFDEKGFLTIGLYGEQPSLCNVYTNVGSLYICLDVFLPLGLSPQDEFWTSEEELTTWERAWSGMDLPCDEKIEDSLG